MGISNGPSLVTDGLILHLDISNRRSFLDSAGSSRSLLNTSTWTVGSGSATNFPQKGLTAENERVVSDGPFGTNTVVWETRPSGDGNGDGGWDGSTFNIDKTKTYRSSVWVRRTTSSSGGTFYHGLHTNGTGDTLNTGSGTSETNPYWDYRGAGSLTQNQWYLNVGHIFPTGYTGGIHPNSGFWTTAGAKVANNGGNVLNDVYFPSNATWAYQRVYHYYCGDNTTRLQFAYPRWDLIDGNEPTIQELLTNDQALIKDLSPYGNHHQFGNYYIPSYESPRRFTFDGANHGFIRTSALNGASKFCTVVIWYSTTDAQELWVRGNGDNGIYLSASAGNNYYHAGCGTPTNYVDLQVCTRPDSPINYRNGNYHMWEAKNVDFSSWTRFDWFLYPSSWQLSGNVSCVLVYNRSLTAVESAQNFYALRSRFGI